LAWAETAEGIGFIRKDGTFVVKPEYDGAGTLHDGLAAVGVGDKRGYIDKAGRMTKGPQFDTALTFVDGLAAVWVSDEKMGYILPTGRFFWGSSK
jgi:hypothetical protein